MATPIVCGTPIEEVAGEWQIATGAISKEQCSEDDNQRRVTMFAGKD